MKNRILIPELMDDPTLDNDKLQAALNDVSLVNKYLGGQQITADGINYFFKRYPQDKYHIADMGCGDGELLRYLARYCRKRSIKAQFTGLDVNRKSIVLAKKRSTDYPEINFKQQDILAITGDAATFDIITTTLTMHHFDNKEIVRFLEHFHELSKLGWVVNDLQRSRIAAILFRGFSRIFMKTKIARYDGLVSIGRSFKRKELEKFASTLGLSNYKLDWRWAFRYLWIVDKKEQK